MQQNEASVLFRPDSDALRFLPECPSPCGPNRFSWIAIQHAAQSTTGSLNQFDLATRENTSQPLDGRPGFAFATDREHVFVIGIERQVRLFDMRSSQWSTLCDGIDRDVTGTIINDGVVFDGGLVFGCKDLQFKEKKAGLYLWRRSDRMLVQLRCDQICSNGKAISHQAGQLVLFDIDSPTKTVVAYPLDVEGGAIGEARTVIDMRDGEAVPDGMILTPDAQSVIVAMYHPGNVATGEARQYNINSGELEAVWKTDRSPRVTCPQLVEFGGRIKLILTTAVEGMPANQLARNENGGCIFIADTPFDRLSEQPVFELPQ